MMPIKKEPKDLFKGTRVYEHCIFCDNPTNTWNLRTNRPICDFCSKVHDVDEIPSARFNYTPAFKPTKK